MPSLFPFGCCWLMNSCGKGQRSAPEGGMNGKTLNLISSVEKHVIRQERDDRLEEGRDTPFSASCDSV